MTSNSNSNSIWEILNEIEIKLINSIQQSSQIILPKIIDSSQVLIDLSSDFYQKSSDLLTNHQIDFFSSILPIHSNSNSNTQVNSNPSNHLSNLKKLSNSNLKSNWFTKLFKPRPILIITGLFLSSRFAFHLFINSDSFHRWYRSNPSISEKIPRCLLNSRSIKKPSRRSLKETQALRQVIIVLGADPGSAASQIAVHLTQIGYIVIASVSRPKYVASIERDGLGWLKALVLDPFILSQTRAFNRSLAACLNLQFPLNSSAHTSEPSSINRPSSLIGLINCLPISLPDILLPVESIDRDDHLISPIQSLTGISLEVIKMVLPMLRNSIEKFGTNDGIILTIFPAKTSSLPLPYLGSSVIANQALETLMTTLRREIMISNSDSKRSIRIINEKIGSFRPSHHFTGPCLHHTTPNNQPQPNLPIHLHSIYAPSLSRRIGIMNLPTPGLAIISPKGKPISQLIKRVQEIIQYPSIQSGSSLSAGNELWKLNTIKNFLPNSLVERWLQLTENLNSWVRKNVISEVDLESQQNLEKMIEKRKFSSSSDWKHQVFLNHSSNPLINNLELDHQDEKKSEGFEPVEQSAEGDVTMREKPTQLPTPPEFITIDQNLNQEQKSKGLQQEVISYCDDVTKDELEETGSILDKGEETSSSHFDQVDFVENSVSDQQMKHSFVGSEIDWNEDTTQLKTEEAPPSTTT